MKTDRVTKVETLAVGQAGRQVGSQKDSDRKTEMHFNAERQANRQANRRTDVQQLTVKNKDSLPTQTR